jgi:PIN domain nuclease of toxin-antitoxin system
MRLLLDTPVWALSLLAPERLAPEVRQALEERDSELWLSPISIWQLYRLVDEGRVVLDGEPDAWVADALRAVPLHEAPLGHEVARRSHGLRRQGLGEAHSLLAATAQAYDLTLVTTDPAYRDVPDLRLLSNG